MQVARRRVARAEIPTPSLSRKITTCSVCARHLLARLSPLYYIYMFVEENFRFCQESIYVLCLYIIYIYKQLARSFAQLYYIHAELALLSLSRVTMSMLRKRALELNNTYMRGRAGKNRKLSTIRSQPR